MPYDILQTALKKGLNKTGLDATEAKTLCALPDSALYDILAVTDSVRREHHGTQVSLCAIVNAKSGLCAEDCSFCSQSSNYNTDVKSYPLIDSDGIAGAAKTAQGFGAREFSIVTSGTGVESDKELAVLSDALKKISEGTGVEKCASLGILKKETLLRLKESGLDSYHHNLETSRSFFPNVCTTHDYDDDVDTIRSAKGLGFHVCSGGVFGLGETWEHRIELALELKALEVDSIPVNFLNPRPGTPLEGAKNLTPMECLRIIALIRLMLPDKDVVVCGGRSINLRDLQPLIFPAGANAMLVGNYLTTPGRAPEDDLKMIEDLGLRVKGR